MPDGALAAIAVRHATRADLGALIVIERASFHDPWAPSSIESSLENERIFVLVATIENMVCGYGVAWTVGDDGEVTHIAVAPEARQQGVGSTLLQEMISECRQRGAEKVFLEVRPSNERARRLYERLGFQKVGLRRQYYRDGEDAIVMQWNSAS
ncbi:MAG: ribosomal protein S18-alanine N-acetyltransferase [Abitibacteriaceae bacterium]|nr:ribosomal protein S18-alanine N-acetyltransferase [Abditibacteriaceae bacterium]